MNNVYNFIERLQNPADNSIKCKITNDILHTQKPKPSCKWFATIALQPSKELVYGCFQIIITWHWPMTSKWISCLCLTLVSFYLLWWYVLIGIGLFDNWYWGRHVLQTVIGYILRITPNRKSWRTLLQISQRNRC